MLKINIRQLNNEGNDFSGNVSVKALGLEISDPSIKIVFSENVDYALHASVVSDGVLVAGQISIKITTECARCLGDYTFTLNVNDVCHFYEDVTDNDLDITDDIREDLLIALPSKFLCSEKCEGLCSLCGKNLNLEKCTCKKGIKGEDRELNHWGELDNLDIK